MVPVFDGSAGQGTRRRVVRSSVDNPWSGGERLLHSLLRRHRITGWVANAELVLRYTWKQLNDEPLVMIGQVRTLLARQSAVLRAASHFSASRRESGDNRDACAAR